VALDSESETDDDEENDGPPKDVPKASGGEAARSYFGTSSHLAPRVFGACCSPLELAVL
jgi:hypothetical protein